MIDHENTGLSTSIPSEVAAILRFASTRPAIRSFSVTATPGADSLGTSRRAPISPMSSGLLRRTTAGTVCRTTPPTYGDSTLWADDVQGVIDDLGRDQPMLYGWSYGGLIVFGCIETYSTSPSRASIPLARSRTSGPTTRWPSSAGTSPRSFPESKRPIAKRASGPWKRSFGAVRTTTPPEL